jgi:hypothetical protein
MDHHSNGSLLSHQYLIMTPKLTQKHIHPRRCILTLPVQQVFHRRFRAEKNQSLAPKFQTHNRAILQLSENGLRR